LKKVFILLALILLVISGCSNLKKEDDDKNKGFDIGGIQSGIGSIDDTNTFDKQKFSYEITISNKEKTEVKRESIEVVLTEWIEQKQMENKIIELTFDAESIVIKGYVIFDAKGLTKNEIVNHEPFIDGVSIVTETGEKIPIKSKFR